MDPDIYDETFDPNTLTKPKLKSILSAQGVDLPGQEQKKDFYVDLFLKHVRGKRREKVAPSTRGIIPVSVRGSPLAKEVCFIASICCRSSSSSIE